MGELPHTDGCWHCSACSFLNSSLLDQCEICESRREEPDVGGMEMEPSGTRPLTLARGIAIVPHMSSIVGGAPEAQSGAWVCPHCSFANLDLLYCEVCEAPRATDEGAGRLCSELEDRVATVRQTGGALEGRQRACPLCSLLNDAVRTACAACNAPLPAVAEPPGLEDGGHVDGLQMPQAADDEEHRLLLSMGWSPEGDEEGGLEEWEIDAAQEGFVQHLSRGPEREGLRERAQRQFQVWQDQHPPESAKG